MHIESATSILVLGLALAAAGCPREQDEPLTSDTSGGQETAEGPEGSVGATVEMPSDSTSMVDPSADSTDESGGEECEGPEGCWSCAPTTPVQVLNVCTDATCEVFPITVDRLPLLERDGSLPPIP